MSGRWLNALRPRILLGDPLVRPTRLLRRLWRLRVCGWLGLRRSRALFAQLRDARAFALPRFALLLRPLLPLAFLLRLEE